MKLRDIIPPTNLNELTFHGRLCTKDCSGHKAGWEWERKNQTNHVRQTPSASFNNGTEIAITQRRANKEPIGTNIRGEKGRFQKFQKVKEPTLNELFDRPVQWRWTVTSPNRYRALFMVNDIRYALELDKEFPYVETSPNGHIFFWDTEFKELKSPNPHGITGQQKEKASVVFATVIAILTEFKKTRPDETLLFTAKEPSREKLYNRIVGTLQQQGYTVQARKSMFSGTGYLVK